MAGTNGKGSVCSFLDAVLQKAGKRTARFTSPHLVRVTERFSFDGQEADDALFLEAFEAVKASYVHFEQEGLGHPTYFEYLFLMFMWMVRRKKPEYVILETGLGGRLDATNCICLLYTSRQQGDAGKYRKNRASVSRRQDSGGSAGTGRYRAWKTPAGVSSE